MKFTGFFACLIVAIDCGEKAVGLQTQQLFAPNMIWIWWIGSVIWLISAIAMVRE